MNVARIAFLCLLLAIAAAAAPRFAPTLLAAFIPTGEPAPVIAAAPLPAPAVAAPRPPDGRKVAINANAQGHFVADAVVEGRAVSVVVDTGASMVALTEETARRLGIRPPPSAYRQPVSTANGVVAAAPVTLSEVRLGGITIRNVGALVIPGDALDVNLLGMTFLSRLTRFEAGGGQLVLVE